MIKNIFKSSRSASFELDNQDIYYAQKTYDVFLNDALALKNVERNVFSLFGLEPDTSYEVKILEHRITFKTDTESASLNVKDFGATGDGVHDDTDAIQTALLTCPKYGRVYVPAGIYHIRPIFLKSFKTLEISKDAILLGNIDRKVYPILPAQLKKHDGSILELSSWEGVPAPTFASIITGIEVEDAKIIGEGIIDENAQNSDWWT
ncbi:MAG: glycoside hydrolase family 28 protein, partial [Acholeplasmataceae bacterium]|nr:glycoside hydrolase family 28 protein [Acholeplasmataceae bacterium]